MAEHSPTPWHVERNSLGWATRIADSNGYQVASCWGAWGDTAIEPAQADAALIVEAVNAVDTTRRLLRTLLGWYAERDRLRNIVRRLADSLDYALDQAGGEWQSDLDSGSEPNFSKERALVREAREAVGEQEP